VIHRQPIPLARSAVLLASCALAVACEDDDSCFALGTNVLTPSGPVAIESLRPGDLVVAFDRERRVTVHSQVTRTWRHHDRAYRVLALPGGGELGVTESHPVFDLGSGRFLPVADVAARGSLAMLSDDSKSGPLAPASIAWNDARRTHGDVIDIAVEGHANFFAEGILVHNKSPPDARTDAPPIDAGP
jgi:hypothetical protein